MNEGLCGPSVIIRPFRASSVSLFSYQATWSAKISAPVPAITSEYKPAGKRKRMEKAHLLPIRAFHKVANPLKASSQCWIFSVSSSTISTFPHCFVLWRVFTWTDAISGLPCPLASAECSQWEVHSGDEKVEGGKFGVSIPPACSQPGC